VNYANTHPGDDTITFAPCLYLSGQTITLTAGELELTDTTGVTRIIGFGSDFLAINANQTSRIFRVASGVTADVSGLAILSGYSLDGGGIYNAGTLTVTGCSICNNHAEHEGGGIWNSGSLTVVNSEFWWNGNMDQFCPTGSVDQAAGTEGGAIENRGTLAVSGSLFMGNVSEEGGAIANNGTLAIASSIICSNHAFEGGGVANRGTFTLSDVAFAENVSAMGDPDIADHNPQPDSVAQDFRRVDNLDEILAQFLLRGNYGNSLRLDGDPSRLSRNVDNPADASLIGGCINAPAFAAVAGPANLMAAPTTAGVAASNDDSAGAETDGPGAKLAAFDLAFATGGTDSFWNPLDVAW
jgi:hypothetical protein